jgi:transcriptional regulator GlxA family with amidase domain
VDRAGRNKLCRSPELALLTGYARMLVRETGELTPELSSRCASHLLDLTVVALGGRRDAVEIANGRGARHARFAAIKADIAANAANPDFSLEWLARRHGLRPRRIRDLFYAEGTGFSDYVLNTRLDLARAELADPSGAGRNIAEIALSCGFSDLSWFNRTFRRRFAMTPSEAREAAAASKRLCR